MRKRVHLMEVYLMPKYNKEDFEKAKQVDIVEFCQTNGIALTNDGERYYRLVDHDSLVIDRRKNTFYWNARHQGGDAINFVQSVVYNDEPHSSVKALEALLDKGKAYLKTEQVHFVAEPYQYQNKEVDRFDRVPKYLHEVRGISQKTINEFHEAGILVQDNFGNAVFKWRGSNQNEIVGASEQGTTIDYEKYGKRGTRKIIQKNSTANFGMSYQVGEARHLKFFESSIDTMSYRDLHPELQDTLLVSMEGLKQNVINNYLINNIKTRQAAPDSIEICVDHDKAGQRFYDDLAKVEYTCKYDNRDVRFQSGIPTELDCKDYNDVLRKHNQQKQLSVENDTALSSELSQTPGLIDVLNQLSEDKQVAILSTIPGQQVNRRLNQLSERLGITVQNNLSPQQFNQQYGQELGIYLNDSRELLLNPNNSKNQNATTIVRELVHQSFNQSEKAQLNLNTETIEKQPASIKNLNAELVAFSICRGLGLNTEDIVNRIKDWRYGDQSLEKLNQQQRSMVKDYVSEVLPEFERHFTESQHGTEMLVQETKAPSNQAVESNQPKIEQPVIEPGPAPELDSSSDDITQEPQTTATIYEGDHHTEIEAMIKEQYPEHEISRQEVAPGITEETIKFNAANQEQTLKMHYGQQNKIDLDEAHQSKDSVTTIGMSSANQGDEILEGLLTKPLLDHQKITYTANNEQNKERILNTKPQQSSKELENEL